MLNEACCTCAALLSSIPPTYNEKTEKSAAHERRLECCNRAICARCTSDNPRFQTYCPYCQVSTKPTSLPQGLRDPPAYSPREEEETDDVLDSAATSMYLEDRLPKYSELYRQEPAPEKSMQPAEDVLHFVDPTNDTVNTLAIRYGIPADALRRKNGLYADHLLPGRKTVLIPGEFYTGGVSLSPTPLGGEEEELRKSKVRKWMVACKNHEYEVALLYLKQADYNLDAAVEAYKEDETWEKNNPMQVQNGKARASTRNSRFRIGGGLSGQLT